MLPTIKDRVRRFVLPKNYVHVRRHKKQLWIEHTGAVSGPADSASWDKCLKVWQALDLLCLESVKVHEDAINAGAVSVDRIIYTTGADKHIRVWGRTAGERDGEE